MPFETRDDATEVGRGCRKYHVRKLFIYDSTLHGDAGPNSDLDVLVEFMQKMLQFSKARHGRI
jgi:predicted nucleotidyltransferase